MTVDQFLQAIGYGAAIIGGGVGTEALRWLRERGQNQVDLQTTIRNELRDDNQTLRSVQEKQQAEMDRLRADYLEQAKEIQKGRLENSRLEGHVQALSDENTKLRNENLLQKGENAYLLAKVEMFEKLLAQMTSTTAPTPAQPAAMETKLA
jgi:predicted nuclease with TOPRIM domain